MLCLLVVLLIINILCVVCCVLYPLCVLADMCSLYLCTLAVYSTCIHAVYSLCVWQLRVIEEGAVEWVQRWAAKAFYRAMGGLDAYTNTKLLRIPRDQRPPSLRFPTLFVCASCSGGDYSVRMLRRFSQLDLEPAGAVILDAHFALFVWVGRECTPVLARMAMDVGEKFRKCNIANIRLLFDVVSDDTR